MAGKRTKRKNPPKKTSKRGKAPVREPVELTTDAVTSNGLDLDMPMPVFPGLVKNRRQERCIRRAFMEWDNGWRKRTPISRRSILNDLPTVLTMPWNGIDLPMKAVVGYASKIRVDENGDGGTRSVKLMLSRPMTWASKERGETVVIDDHIWLDIGDCIVLRKEKMRVHYGDLVLATFNVKSYEYRGMHRLGIGKWVLLDSIARYVDAKRCKSHIVPDVFGDESVMLQVRAKCPYGNAESFDCMSEEELERYLSDLASDASLRNDIPVYMDPDDATGQRSVKLLK